MENNKTKMYKQKIEAQQKEIAELRAELAGVEEGIKQLNGAVDSILIETARAYGQFHPSAEAAGGSEETEDAAGASGSGESFTLSLSAERIKRCREDYSITAAAGGSGVYTITVTKKPAAE